MIEPQTPQWLKKRLVYNEDIFSVKQLVSEYAVQTVCESALCPNLNECFSEKRATFLILGKSCTRRCPFCAVAGGERMPPDKDEPARILGLVKKLGMKHVIITSVTRDDLMDGGTGQFVKTIEALREALYDITIEILIPDFNGKREAIESVAAARPDIIGHNIETVKGLYPVVRPGADYNRSLNLLRLIKALNPDQLTKSSIMVGLGETEEEVVETMKDLRDASCDILAIGQYLKPASANLRVERFVSPEEFKRYRLLGEGIGFRDVNSGPFVRSSYFKGG